MALKISRFHMVINCVVLFGSAIILTVLHSRIFVSLHKQKKQLNLAPEQVKKKKIQKKSKDCAIAFDCCGVHSLFLRFLLRGEIQLPCFYK